MKKNMFGLMSAALLLAGTAWAANQVFNDKAEAAVQVQEDANGLQVSLKEIRYITGYLGDYSKNILIKATVSTSRNTGTEGVAGSAQIEARSKNDFFATPIWTATDQGEYVNYENESLIVSRTYGCCGDYTRSTLYNVETGKSPGTYLDDDFYTITVPNSGLGNRYLAQVDDKSAPKTNKSGKNYIGSIAYMNDAQTVAIARFYATVPAGWGAQITDIKLVNLAGSKSKNELRDKELELWDSDGEKNATSAFKNFGIEGAIDFENEHLTLQVPVNGDQIDQKNIKASQGLEFEVLN